VTKGVKDSSALYEATRILLSSRACENISNRSSLFDEPARLKWLRHWLDAGSRAIEDVLVRDPRTGRFCCGDLVDAYRQSGIYAAKILKGAKPDDLYRVPLIRTRGPTGAVRWT
jgi:hypothetical protein